MNLWKKSFRITAFSLLVAIHYIKIEVVCFDCYYKRCRGESYVCWLKAEIKLWSVGFLLLSLYSTIFEYADFFDIEEKSMNNRITGKISPHLMPILILFPAFWVIRPTIPGPILPPKSPAMARRENIAVPLLETFLRKY